MTPGLYNESGINIDLRGHSHFRFEDCEGYRKIKGWHVKEIDFGWWNEEEECLYLLEIKNLTSNPDHLSEKEKSGKLIDNLWKKSLDVILILSAVWLDNVASREIKSCLPTYAQQKCKVKIFHLIKCDKSIEHLLNAVNDRLKDRFRGYKQLYENLLAFKIISNRQAERILINILSK